MSDDNIVFPCPACGTKYSVSPHHAGKKTTCKKCGASVTVPTPQVANPTIVGGTRTIRRADIDPGASAREEAVEAGRASDVDMSGGQSVLRKEETVIGAPPMNVGTRGPAQRGGTRPAPAGGRPTGRPNPGRPSPYGGPGAPAKKNNMPMMLGIGGGVLALILVVVIIAASSGGGGGGGDGSGTDGDVAGADGSAGTPKLDADAQLLAEMRKNYNNYEALTADQVKYYYVEAGKRKDNAEFKAQQSDWAKALARKADSSGNADELADIALMLDTDGYPGSRVLLDTAWKALKTAKKATREVKETDPDGRQHMTLKPNPKFKDIVERLGWMPYKKPIEMDEAQLYECEGAKEYNNAYLDIDQVFRDVELYPPEMISSLKDLEGKALDSLKALKDLDAKDGFAIRARQAWLRFKQKQGGGKVDRQKGKRSFSAKAMGRESESIDQIWTYTYWKPFMVYVERGIGQDDLDADFIESLESKAALLKHEYDWFSEHLINKYNLQRVKPEHDAERAEQEGWPMEIVVFKDSATMAQFYEDSSGQPAPPGVRAYYSPRNERVVTYDDTADMSPDTQWFNESVLIHESFHMLSDFYAANPMFDEDEMQTRPRYPNILVQEGLTDSVSGFSREGEGLNATYEFLQLNHIRLRDFQHIYDLLGKNLLYRVRDALDCRHYGQCVNKAFERAAELKLKLNPLWLQQAALGVYYPTVCQMSYFFQNYKEGGKYPYRDKWWDYLGKSYTGEIKTSNWSDNTGIVKFKEIFGIKNDKDWDDLDKKFVDFTLNLSPEDVGKGGGIDDKGAKEGDSINPGLPPMPGLLPGESGKAVLPSREDEE
ncbi:MAG: hypothetical protein KDB90_13655 [Planctomycetes bacterium]|nr:hypothetical protein [Planctomycetota bacterium]